MIIGRDIGRSEASLNLTACSYVASYSRSEFLEIVCEEFKKFPSGCSYCMALQSAC